ncbi:hypothetical protein [Paracoccus yeei]|uniref:Mobilization protein C (MobC) n=1 Tax=Paracoccus yeei TaxID=147645 RepID=A0A0D5A109_9RHOB|nr:hypothetical protein [Paracoccus yeei]AJW30069.1 mobilization protein C (MobC) [Paracoccus yeei]OWJ93500.1 hypothetical protein CDV54_11585 [Paracoccus yeei]
MARTIDQQIAEAQAKLNRLRMRQKASETRRKIIVGAIVTTEALKDPKIARWMAATLRRNATREVDQKEIEGLLAELDAKAQSAGAGEA